ncbi:LPD38 domain-containing protein [Haemophilus parahaemolyticus]|uniref:MuF-C-terminal domain-containing protein n=1 Tax=Haemophilus parahaemolyticus TaxID=735 RepID=UPI0024939D07|nr:LPD38 domain-containing protein [Haemophilus parahaemolyticus]
MKFFRRVGGGEGKLRTIEKEYSAAKQINDYLGNREEQKALENGANEVSALLANLKTNPMQLPHLLAEQVPQVLLGVATGSVGLGAVNAAGGVGRARNDIEQAYEDTYKNNPQQLLQLPEIQERMAKGMSFADAVNDAKTDVTDHWKSLAAAAVIGASEALTPTGKLGQGVNRGVFKTLGKEAGQEFLQEGAEQLNSNLAVGQIDGKTQATDNVLRNATLGAIAGLGMGVPAATEAYINGRNAPQAEEPVVNPESPTQPEQPTTTLINSQALDEALKPYQDSEEYAEMRADLEQDIQDGVIEERAKSNSQYGKLAQAYLNATGQVTAEPQAESNTQEQAEINDGTDPEMERVLNLRERMTAWRNGKKLGKIGDLLPAMMTFKNEDAKRDFVVQQAFGEVQSIAKKHGIDPTDGNAMRKWLDDYVAKRKEVQTKAKQTREESYRAYDDFLSNEPLAVEPEQAVENPQNVTNLPDNFITQASNEAFKKYEGELNALVSDVYEGKITAEEFEQRKNAFIHAVSKEATEKLTQHQDFVPYIREKVLAHNKLTQAETELQQTAEPQRVEENAELRFSLNESSDSPFAKAVDTVAQGGNVSGYVNVGTTPSVLKMLGLPDVKVSIHSSTFKKVMGGKHQVTPETLKQLPQQINNPIAVMRSSTEPNGYVVLTELIERENGKDKPVIAALHLKQDANGLELLNIASVYGRSNAQIQRGLNNDLLYWNKAKGTKFVSTFGLQLPAYVDNNSSLSARNVKTETDLSQYQNPQSEQSIETESDEQLTQESYSRSPIKSVDANIKRGREAMNKAIAERRTVHRAMFNHNLDGWVDFEWGDVGTVKANGKTKGGMGISHILEARMRKDGMSYEQATQMLVSDVVDVIARGHTVFEKTVGNSQNIRMEHNGYQVTLTKNKGNNAWIVTAFELFEGANRKGYDKSIPTDTNPTLSRAGTGASNAASDSEQFARNNRSQLNDTHAHSQRGRGVVAENGLNLNNSQQNVNVEESHARELLRRALGEHADKIEFVRDEQFGENDARRGAEGWYHNGKLYLNLDGITDGKILSKDERLVWVAWHELGHHGVEVQLSQALRNQLHQARKNVVVNGIAKRIFAERQAEAKRENNPNLAISQDVATEEAIVELFAAMETGNWAEIENRYRVHIVQEWRQPQSDLVKRLSHVANFFKRLVARITGRNLDTVSNQEVLNLLATVKQGIAKSAENTTASDARYSLSEESDSDFAKAVDEVFNSSETHFDNNRWIKLGTTPEALIQSGISEEPMYINFAKIGKIKNDHPEMTADLLKQIPKELNNPVAVFKNTKGKANSYVVLTELSVKGNERVIAALHADQEMNGLVFHKLASAYGKDGTRAYLENMIEKSDVRFVDKRKAGRINSRLQLLADDTLDLLFNKASIVKDESSVNADKEKGSQLANVHWLQLPLKLRSDANLSANDIKTETDLSQYQSENSEVRFSRKAPKQDTPYQRDLMVTHNISAKGIMHAKKMGGLPFASVAVAKQSNPLTGFGEVTLIGNRDYIDPKGANKAKVFGADIYSPRHSGLGITYRINAKDVNALNKQFEESAKAIGDNKFSYDFSYQGLEDKGVVNTLENSTAVKYQFLKENGVAVEPVYDAPVEVANNQMNYPSIQQAKAQGISRSAFVNNDELLTRFVEDHIADLSERLEKAEKMGNSLVRNHAKRNLSVAQKILESGIESIRHHYRMKILDLKYDEETQAAPRLNAGKTATKINELVEERASDFADYVDNIASSIDVEERIDDGEARDGTRKTIPHNLENVVKKLKQNIRGGEKFGIGQGNVRAKVTPQFDSIADIQDNKHRIVSADEFETVRSELEAEAQALGNEFNTSDIYDLLWNAAEEGIPQAFHYADVKNTARNRKLVQDYLDKLEAMPTEYFEGKAKDVTQFSDFSGAVIPNNLPKNAYDVLQQAGLKIYEYDPDVETSRAEIIKQATNELDEQSGGNILFSRKARTNDLDADFENATPKRTANSFEEARAAVTELLGEPLVNRESGMIATISKRSLDKLVSGKAADKSSSREDHLIAVANIDQLFENAIEGWAEPAKSEENTALKSVHKMFAPININGEMKLAKLTVKEFNDNSGNRIYSVETLEVGNKNSTMPELSASVQSERTLDGLHSATLNSLIQRIQDFNSRDENSDPLFSRKLSRKARTNDLDVDFENATPKRTANSFAQVKELAKAFLNKTLHNDETGIDAVISRANLEKMLSGKAHSKSTSLHDHLLAVANVDSLFKNAIHGWAEPYNKNDSPDVVGVHKMFAPLNIDGNVKLVKLTVKELKPEQGNRVYSVETIEIGNEKAPVPEMAELGFDSNSHRLHEGSGDLSLTWKPEPSENTKNTSQQIANVRSLIQRIQDFNSRDENSEPLFSRKQTSMEILTDGKVKHETFWGTVKAGEFSKIWNEVQRKTDFALTDETRPVLDWIGDLDLAQVQANELKSDFELADGVRHSLNSQLMQRFLKPLHKNIVNLAKKRKKDIEWTKKALGIWVSANYSIQKNQELLARDEQAMIEAKQAFDDAKANGTNAEIDKAERAYIRAERQYRYRKHDVELNNWEVDEKGKFIVPRKVGVAGFSIPHAKALMAEVEKHFSQKEVQEATEPLRKAVKWNIHKNREFNRITEEQFKEYMRNLDYVPLTGDPDSLLKDDDDFIGGASSKGVNTSRDKNMKGRVNSEAEDAIDAVYRMLDKTVANAAWQPFKNGIDTVYEQKLAEAKAQGMTEEQAKEHVADTVGIRRQVMQGTTRTNDEVLIRKFGNVYYEYRLPEDVIKAIKGGQRNVDEFQIWQHKLSPMRYVRKLTGLNAQGVTQFKLPFAPKNMIRDIWEKSALITTRDIYDANGKPLSQKAKNRIGNRTFSALANPAEMARVLRATSRLAKGDTENLDVSNEYQRDLKELIELGGVSNYSTYLARTDKDLVEEIKKLDKPHHRAVEGALHLVAVWNGTFDYASSLAAYRALKEAGVDKKQAADITLNLTNFRKQGWAAKHFKPLYMFLNPTLQGGKNLVQMMKTRRGQVYLASRTVMAMAVWSFLMALDDEDDEAGKRMLANGDLSREILIPTGEKDKYIRIPVGYGAPQMANNIATNLVQLMNNQISVGDAVANIITHNVKSVLPIAPSEIPASKEPLAKLFDTLSPTMVKAQLQWVMNRSAFGGILRPTTVQREKLLSQQSFQDTAEFWKETAEMMYEQFGVDMHPEFYKHIFDSYRGMMGSLGDYVSASIENPNRALQGKSEVVPILNDYYGVKGENRIASLFYEYKGEAEKLAAEYKYYESKGRLAEWKTPEKMQIVNWNNKVNDEMKKVTQARSNLKKDEEKMSEEMKASRLQNINTINDRIQREAVYAWRKREGLATANPR